MGLLLGVAEVVSDVLSWLCKPISEIMFVALDTIEQIVMGLAGISSKATMQNGKAENIVVTLLQSDTTRKLMSSMMLFGICVLFLCVILAIVRNVYKDDSKVTISSIIGQAIRAVIGFILVPGLCIVGVMLSNVILQAIAGVTSAGGRMGNSFSSGIYEACSVGEKGSIFLNYTTNMTEEDLNTIFNDFKDDKDVKNEETQTSMEFATIMYAQYLYYLLTENYYWRCGIISVKSSAQGAINYMAQTAYTMSRQVSGLGAYDDSYNDGFIDILGIKTPSDECAYLTPAVMNYGGGNPNYIDTPEDVIAFYNVLYSQYLNNFPNALGLSYTGESQRVVQGQQFVGGIPEKELIELAKESGKHSVIKVLVENSYNFFGCPKTDFAYYYHGKCVYDWNANLDEMTECGETVGDRGFRLLKGAWRALCNSGEFATIDNGTKNNMRFDFQLSSNSLTNAGLKGALGLGTSEMNWFYAFMASVLVFKSLFFICFGLAKRIVQLLVYYILSPIALALYPFDNGKAFGSWKSDFVGYTIGAYGAVAGMNISIQLVGTVLNNINIFYSGTLNAFTRLIMYIVLAQGIESLVKMLSGWIGGKDLLAEGKETSNKATAPIKKVAGAALKIGGAVVGGVVAAKTAAKIASNKRRQAADDKTTFNNMPADQQEEIARAHGFNSAADYMSSLDKTIADNGSGSAFFKSAGKSALAGAGQILGSTTGGALGKSAMDGYKAFRGDQSTPSDSWLARKLGGKGDAYRQLQEVQSKTTAAVLGSESQAIVSSAMDKFVEKTSEPINKSITAANVEMTAAQTNLRSAEQNLAKVEKQFNAALENAVGVMTSKNGLDVSKDDAKAMLERGDFSSVQNDPVKYALAVEEVARFSQTKIAQTYQEANDKVQEAHSSVQAIQSSIDNLNDKLAETSMSGGDIGTFISNVNASIDPNMLGNLMAAGDTATIERVVKNAISSQAKADGISLGDDFMKQLVDTIMKTMAGPAKQLKETADKIKQTTTGKK